MRVRISRNLIAAASEVRLTRSENGKEFMKEIKGKVGNFFQREIL